eukprot:3053681-Pyramimonas_sp.AAC.1
MGDVVGDGVPGGSEAAEWEGAAAHRRLCNNGTWAALPCPSGPFAFPSSPVPLFMAEQGRGEMGGKTPHQVTVTVTLTVTIAVAITVTVTVTAT